jgi:F-type H+-transporting ATPase subunit c
MDLAVLTTFAQAADPTDGLKAIALGVGAGLGTIGPGIGVGYIRRCARRSRASNGWASP